MNASWPAEIEAYIIDRIDAETQRLEAECSQATALTDLDKRNRLHVVQSPDGSRFVASWMLTETPSKRDLLRALLDDLEAEMGPVTDEERAAIDDEWPLS